MSRDTYFSVFTRSVLQVIVNIIAYVVLVNTLYGAIPTYTSSLYTYLKTLFTIPVLIIFSSLLLKSVILGFLNTSLILFVLNPTLFTNPLSYTYILTTYIASLLVLLVIVKLFSLRDLVIEQFKTGETPRSSNSVDRVLGNYALFFATSSISLPLITYLVIQTLTPTLSVDTVFNVKNLITYFAVNMMISLIALVYTREPSTPIKFGILSSLNVFSTTPLIALSLNEIIQPSLTSSLARVLADSSEKGVLLGLTKARLIYSIPKRIYKELRQDWIKSTRRKTWYWMEFQQPLYLDPDKLVNRHIVIMGSSGSGKSLLAKHLLLEYYSKYGVYFIVFDPHNEYYVLRRYIPDLQVIDASKLGMNPLELGRLNPRERAHQLSNVIMSLFRLGHLQRQAIEELIALTYEYHGIYVDSPSTWSSKPPTLHDVLDTCRKLMEDNDLYKRVYPYLRILADNVFIRQTIGLDKIMNKPTIITLNNLKSDYVRILYVDTFLQRLLDMMYRRELRREYMIVLDEAYTLLARDYSRNIASRLLMESRKYGIGIVFITQHPLSIPTPIIENAAIKISFNIAEPRNLDYVSKMFSGVYLREKINMIRTALRNLKSLNYILAITGLSDIFIVSEEDIAETILGKPTR